LAGTTKSASSAGWDTHLRSGNGSGGDEALFLRTIGTTWFLRGTHVKNIGQGQQSTVAIASVADSVVVGGPQPRSAHGLAIQANAMAVSRLPARPMASVQKSERTTPCEGFVSGGLVTEQSGIQPKSTMQNYESME
jgi:hypothetical protein